MTLHWGSRANNPNTRQRLTLRWPLGVGVAQSVAQSGGGHDLRHPSAPRSARTGRRHQQPPRRSQLQVPALWPNFKVNVVTGKWGSFGCDCASTEEGKRAIRNALSPAKPRYPDNEVRRTALEADSPEGRRVLDLLDREGKPILEVRRSDDGKGNRKIRQHSLIRPPPQRCGAPGGAMASIRQSRPLKMALLSSSSPRASHAPMPCAALAWRLSPPSVVSNGFNSDRDGGHFDHLGSLFAGPGQVG